MPTYPAVKKVKPVDDYKLILTFSNRETRLFDMKPYLGKGIFKELRDVSLFCTAHVNFDTVEWDNEADFDPEVLYTHSKKINEKKYAASFLSAAAFVSEPKTKYRKK
jgi:hypothetical protein